MYSRTSRQSIKSQIVVPTHAGPYGDAPLACNTADFCGELDERLHALNTTLRGVHEDVHAKLTLQQETITKPTLDRIRERILRLGPDISGCGAGGVPEKCQRNPA